MSVAQSTWNGVIVIKFGEYTLDALVPYCKDFFLLVLLLFGGREREIGSSCMHSCLKSTSNLKDNIFCSLSVTRHKNKVVRFFFICFVLFYSPSFLLWKHLPSTSVISFQHLSMSFPPSINFSRTM